MFPNHKGVPGKGQQCGTGNLPAGKGAGDAGGTGTCHAADADRGQRLYESQRGTDAVPLSGRNQRKGRAGNRPAERE